MVVHIAYQNVNGLRTKVEEFRNGVINHHAKIICLTETNLIPDIYDAEIFPHGYSVFRRDRVSSCKKTGGGVLVAVDDSFKSCARSDLACEGSEDLWVHVHHAKIICLTETNLIPDIYDAEIFPHGYSVFRRDRVSSCKKNGGGVLVAVDDSFKSCARSDLACEGSEDLWVHVSCGSFGDRGFYICCVYLPPSDDNALIAFLASASDVINNHPDDLFIILGANSILGQRL
ncbi:hypothetical protein QE152_g24639 [Popillia japonica]|uniref:Uncharacterized protein n=1 Tax=Popillia japonica TaxID=7064 RepID=A0AAW1K6C4_POPJA